MKKLLKRNIQILNGKKILGLPFVVESKIVSLKTKDLISSLKKILGEKFYSRLR